MQPFVLREKSSKALAVESSNFQAMKSINQSIKKQESRVKINEKGKK